MTDASALLIAYTHGEPGDLDHAITDMPRHRLEYACASMVGALALLLRRCT